MQRCVDFMSSNGGKLHRHPGGFWWREKADYGFSAFGSSTVKALELRGRIKFTEQRRGRSGEFPITAELVPGAGQ